MTRQANLGSNANSTRNASGTSIHRSSSSSQATLDIWDKAYKLLREDQEKAKLVKEYEKYLHKEFNISIEDISKGVNLGQDGVLETVQAQHANLSNKACTLTLGTKVFDITNMFETIGKPVMFIKETMDLVGSVEPHVGIALAGLCIFLPVSAKTKLY